MIKTKSINSKFCLYTIYVLVILLLFTAFTPKVFAACSFPTSISLDSSTYSATVGGTFSVTYTQVGGSVGCVASIQDNTTGSYATVSTVDTDLDCNGGSPCTISASANVTFNKTLRCRAAGTYSIRGYNGIASSVSTVTCNAADSTAPVISSVIPSSIASTSAAISWTTDESASSIVDLGFVNNSYSWSTPESDTSPRVASHSVTLNNLLACSVYHYRVRSTDASSNAATSTDSMFATPGCTASALVMASSTTAITTASGGSIALLTDSIGPTLTVPASFSGSDATFQIKQLDKTSVISSISVPSGYSALGSHIYDFKALSATSTSVSSFDSAITVSIAYSAGDASGMDESTLKIYRYDGSSWNQLSSCSVNTSTKTVSCATTAFSTFGLFGLGSVSAGGGPGFLLPIQYISPVADVQAIAGDGNVSLSWTNPMDSTFDHTVIIRKRGSTPSLHDGTMIFNGNTNQFIDTGVLNNEIYYYAIYAVDSSNDVSYPVVVNAIFPRQSAISSLSTLSTSASAIPKAIGAVQPAPQGVALGFNFVRPIAFGMINNDVRKLQETLKADSSVYPKGYITGYFGPLTLKAVKRFQLKYSITTENGPGYGYVGPKTRKKLNELR